MTKYEEGERFRVIKEGARFEGLLLFGEQSISGWSRHIIQGEVLTCLGWKEVQVFGTNVAGVMWTGLKVPDNAMVMQIWPFESIFRPFPLRGLLEHVQDPDSEADLVFERISKPAPEEIDEGHIVDLTSYLPLTERAKVDNDIVDLTGM